MMLKLTTSKGTRCKSCFGTLRRKPIKNPKVDSKTLFSEALTNKHSIKFLEKQGADFNHLKVPIMSFPRTQVKFSCVKLIPNIRSMSIRTLRTFRIPLQTNKDFSFIQKRYYSSSPDLNDNSADKKLRRAQIKCGLLATPIVIVCLSDPDLFLLRIGAVLLFWGGFVVIVLMLIDVIGDWSDALEERKKKKQ